MNAKTFTVCKFTILETIKSKVFYGSIFMSGIFIIAALVGSEISYSEKTYVILDFGLGLTSLFTIFLSIYFGVGLIANDIENRTLYCILSKPLERSTFILGKIIGVMIPLTIIILAGCCLTFTIYSLKDGQMEHYFFWAPLGMILESLIALTFSCFASLFANRILSTMYTVALFLFGHLISEFEHAKYSETIIKAIIRILKIVLPGLNAVNFKNLIVYQQEINITNAIMGSLSITLYAVATITLSIVIFSKKDLD